MMKRILSLSLVALLASLPACLAAEEGPELPPTSSMQMDTSLFQGALSAEKADEATTGSKANFNAAAFRVGALNLTIGLALLPPAAVFAAALTAEPRFEAGAWIWEYELQSGGETFEATLTGSFGFGARTGTTLELEMAVTCTACATPLHDYVWYTGSFDIEGRFGHWQLYNPEIAQADQTGIRIDYEVTDETHRSLTFENLRTDGHENAGDLIDYTRDGDLLTIWVHDASEGIDYMAQGDYRTGEGWLEVPGYNGGEKACWDGDQYDVPCAD